MRKVTAELLAEKGAHCDEIDEFRERFPDGVDLETVQPKEVVGLNVQWAVHALLPPPAREAFKEATAPAWKAHEEATASVWKAYKEAYKEAKDAAWEAYEEAEARAAIAVFREHWQVEEAEDE